MSPFESDFTEEERQYQLQRYGKVMFAPSGCISIEEFCQRKDKNISKTSCQTDLHKKIVSCSCKNRDCIKLFYSHIDTITILQQQTLLKDFQVCEKQ